MRVFNRLTAMFAAVALLAPMAPLQAKTKKGDKLLAEGRVRESKKEWDEALALYEEALDGDPGEILYQMAAQKARFQAAQVHIEKAIKIRASGMLGEALIEFQRAYTINPGSSVAAQEIFRTEEMIQRERKRVEATGKESDPQDRGLTPSALARKQLREKINRILPVPELRPLNPDAVRQLKINGQSVRVTFETIGTVAGINVLWDPEYQQPPQAKPLNIDFANLSLEEALDAVAMITKSYWKPLSPGTIFITNDNPNKRRDFVDMIAKTFYLTNVNTPQEIQEIVNAIRSVSELQRVVAYNSQNAILVRGEADQVALAEKMIMDLDKPKAEVVVDVLVMEANSLLTRRLTAAVAPTGLNLPLTFNPRPGIRSLPLSDTGTGTGTGTGTPSTTPVGTIPGANLGRLSSADFALTLPSALLQAALTDTKTKVLQAPQLRSVDNVKASVKIGERQPTAVGSFQPGIGIGGGGVSPLVNTQFQFIDVGVNVEVTPRVHENNEISMLIDLDISNVTGQVDLGGIKQPIIGQRKVSHNIRLQEGEVNLLGGLINQSETKLITGIPGLSSIPLLGKLFSGESVDRNRSELMIALIPHIVRRQDIYSENLKGIAVGNGNGVKITYGPAPRDEAQPVAAATPKPVLSNAATAAPPATAPPATAPPATAPIVPTAATPPATAPPLAPPATAPPLAPPATAPPTNPPPAPGAGARVYFSPLQTEVQEGGSITATLALDGGTDVASAPLQIRYDPKLLRLNDVVPGGFLSNDGKNPVFTKNILNEMGVAAIALNRQPGSPGVNGSGALVTLNFTALTKGNATIAIPNLVLRNSQGGVINSTSPQLNVTIR